MIAGPAASSSRARAPARITRVAHRGAPTHVLENTLRSIQLAESCGADATELDVRATRDGVPVLLHDRTLERMWGDARPVAEVGIAEVRALRARSPDGGTETIPTFEEVLDATRALLVIDVKATSVIGPIGAMLEARGHAGRARFIGEPEMVEAVRATMPRAAIVMSWKTPQLPPADLLGRVRPFAINLKWTDENAAAAPAFAQLGYEIWSYTIDDAATARRALDAGIRGLISNDLHAIAPALGVTA